MSSKTIYIGNRAGLSDELIGRMAFTGKDFVDDPYVRKFSTIQEAIDRAYSKYGALSSADAVVVVKIAPGIYTEQIHSYLGYYLCGMTTADKKSVTLYNTGLDAAHYPLRSDGDEHFIMTGINIQTDAHGVYGKIPSCHFYDCRFTNGDFIESADSVYAEFTTCRFKAGDHGGFNFTGTNLTGTRAIVLNRSSLINPFVEPTFSSTHTSWAVLTLDDVSLKGNLNISGDWGVDMQYSETYGYSHRNVFNTTGEIHLFNVALRNGVHFTSAPSVFSMINSSFIEKSGTTWIPDGEADITSDVDVTCDFYSNNSQQNGLAGSIKIPCPVKAVGCAVQNKYLSVQDAINSIVTEGVVDLRESLTGLAELTIPSGIHATIDGHKLYSLSFTTDIVELNASEELVFYGLSELNGNNIEVNGNSAYVGFEECLTVNAYVTLTAGTGVYCLVYSSTIKAPTGHPAITQNDVTSTIVSGYSRVDGGVGHPAILTTVEADSGIKAKFSTLVHGDGAGNAPLVYTGANKMDILVYNCALNAAWNAAHYTNLVGSPNNTTDANINF